MPKDETLMLERAIRIAVQAHHGQRDKVGQPYILHPLRMMLRMETDLERIVAILHDVVEDTPVTFAQLKRNGFSSTVVSAVNCLTRRQKESYAEFIQRIRPNLLARRVKIVDLKDNLDIRRLPALTDRDQTRLKKYRSALRYLL